MLECMGERVGGSADSMCTCCKLDTERSWHTNLTQYTNQFTLLYQCRYTSGSQRFCFFPPNSHWILEGSFM